MPRGKTFTAWPTPDSRVRDPIPVIGQAGGRRATTKPARTAHTGECIHAEAWSLAMLAVAA